LRYGAASAAGIETKIGNHTFRATGITAYLKNGGRLGNAAAMANLASTRTTQLYDRRHVRSAWTGWSGSGCKEEASQERDIRTPASARCAVRMSLIGHSWSFDMAV
jgi:hypothetical protein